MGRVPNYPWQGLGWKLDPWMGGVEGFLLKRNAFGHTGWTGTLTLEVIMVKLP